MKRSTFFYVAFRIVFTTVITSNLTLKLAAHDLPSDARSFHHARLAYADRVDSPPSRTPSKLARRTLPTAQPSICHVADWAASSSDESLPTTQSNSWVGLAVVARRPANSSGDAADSAVDPIAQTASYAKKLTTRGQFDENYLPYDLSMRDWRHRDFTTRNHTHILSGSAATQPTAVTEQSPESHSRDLSGLFLHSLQSQVTLFGGRLANAAAGLTKSLQPAVAGRILGLASAQLGSAQQNATEQGSELLSTFWQPRMQPFFRSPQLVRMTMPDGRPLLVSLKIARSLGVVSHAAPDMPQAHAPSQRHLLDTQVAKTVKRYFIELGTNYQACLDATVRNVALALDLNQVQRVASSQGPVR